MRQNHPNRNFHKPSRTGFHISVLAPPAKPHPFADSQYLLQVIGHLKQMRIRQGLSLRDVAVRSRIKRDVINQAEQNGSILKSREFRAWSAALGTSWEQVWSDCFPPTTLRIKRDFPSNRSPGNRHFRRG